MKKVNYSSIVKCPERVVKTSSLDYIDISSHQFITLYCAYCGNSYHVKLKCSDKTCPDCRKRKFWTEFSLYKQRVKRKQRLRLITLTLLIKHSSKAPPYYKIRRVRNAFRNLLRRSPYNYLIKGGLYSVEAIQNPSGWNVHLHVLAEGFFISQARLSKDWKDITGDSYIVDIRKVYNGLGGLKYILKYLLKSPVLTDISKDEYNRMFYRVRFISAFGSWYHAELEREKKLFACDRCGCYEWLTEFDLNFLEKNYLPP
jgi:hypothetical protein